MSYDTEVAADSPLGYWKLDETSGTVVADSSGNGRDMTNGTATINQATVMPTGTASYDFDSVADALSLASATWMNATDFTVEAWIRPDATSSYRAIISRDGTSAGRSWSLYVHNGKLDLLNGAVDADGATTLSIGSVYHVAFTYVASGTQLKLYVNGVQDLSVTRSITHIANVLRVGTSQAGTGSLNFPFDGRIDNIAYYGTALSAARILAHYNAGLSSAQVVALGTATEADAAVAVAKKKVKLAGVSAETDAAVTIARKKTIAVGTATETEAAQAVTHSKSRAVGTATETDTAVPIVNLGAHLLGVAAETDAAVAFGRKKTLALGTATETEAASAVAHSKRRDLGTATESDTAVTITNSFAMFVAVGTAFESDDAPGFAIARIINPVDTDLSRCGVTNITGWADVDYDVPDPDDPPGISRADQRRIHISA